MKKWIEWFADNGVAANLLMVLLVAGGTFAAFGLRKEVVPEITMDIILVSVPFPGATPAEIEESICGRVEEEVEGLSGVKKITSTASEGMGMVSVELLLGTDTMKLLGDVKSRVDAISNFPADAEEPIVQQLDTNKQVITVAVIADTDEWSLRSFTDEIRNEIAALPGITKTRLSNVRPYEVSIEVSEDRLSKYGMDFDEVAQAVRASSLDLPGGSIKAKGGEILLRSLGQAYKGVEFENLVLRSMPDGTRILLGDIATIHDAFADQDIEAQFDGKSAAMVQIFRVGEQSAFEIVDAVLPYVEHKQKSLPEGVSLVTWRNDVEILQGRLSLLLRNGFQGFILVFLSLALFLRFKLAFWVTLGIPFSFLGALWLLPALAVSINIISLFGFIIVLGVVVDDAIVIGENVFTHLEQGKSGPEAAKDGTMEMLKPVSFAILTTMAAFSVMLGIPGIFGQFARNIPLVVIATLVFSFVEAFFVLPAHLRHMTTSKETRGIFAPITRTWLAFQGLFTGLLDWLVHKTYKPALSTLLSWRYTTMSGGIAILLLTIGLSRHLVFEFFPSIDSDYVSVTLTMPLGTPFEETRKGMQQLESAAREIRQEIDKDRDLTKDGSIYKHVSVSLGSQPFSTEQKQNSGQLVGGEQSSHLGEILINLAQPEKRQLASQDIARLWREKAGTVPGAVEVNFTASIMDAGKPIQVRLAAKNPGTLVFASRDLQVWLAEQPGAIDISDSHREGKRELRIAIRPKAEALGLRLSDLARQVRQAFYGDEAQRIQRGRDDLKVMVRYSETERRSLSSIEAMFIRTQTGDEVPLSTVADLSWGRGPATVTRFNRRRSIDVFSDVDTALGGNETTIKAGLKERALPDLMDKYPGLSYSFEGSQAEQAEFMGGMVSQAIFALLLIYALLAVPLRSYMQPLIIMSVIPFGIVGALLGHIFMGAGLSMMSFIGLIALTGIVVNDSLVIVDFVNRYLSHGGTVREAIERAGVARFRPILLTSLTTFSGLLPLMFETSMQAQFLIPAAISLAFGVLFATLLTLVFVPCLYLMLEDFHKIRHWISNLYKPKEEVRAWPEQNEQHN
jgi:multidrug efflux pump subunit AcrB